MKNYLTDLGRCAARDPSAAADIAIIGTYPPRRCGLATFTQDLLFALQCADPKTRVTVCAMRPTGFEEPFGDDVSLEINQASAGDYVQAAARLNARGVPLICLQHEFGIFGGEAGSHILRLLERLDASIVTTLHTVAPDFDAERRQVVEKILRWSAKVVVMAEKGRDMLLKRYGADPARVEVIPHGAPARPRPDTQGCKRKLGLEGRRVLMTFGLISRGKGLETMIRALPAIAARDPSVLYLVLGATHPNVVATEGESYRASLVALAKDLGVADNVRFIDKYASLPELIDHLSAADIYVTPYLNKAQITSGTLAYAFALGKPIVSTPYWHAIELLADGRGVLCDFNDADAFARSINRLLADPGLMEAMGAAAHAHARSMHWPVVGKRYLDLFATARESSALARRKVIAMPKKAPAARSRPSLDHLDRMTDRVGLFQHAHLDAPDPREGYCVDDNARALLLMTHLAEQDLADEALSARESVYAAFVERAWNPDVGRFRNFMSYGGRWLETCGSEDSHGRTLLALARARVFASTPDRRAWAEELFHEAMPAADDFTSPRACAHALNAAVFYDRHALSRENARRIARLAARLSDLFDATASPDWLWFERSLAYENAVLPAALINAGVALGNGVMIDKALAALDWLAGMQTSDEGWFRPVGTESFGCEKRLTSHFDQQPIEGYAMIAAFEAALLATDDRRWLHAAEVVFKWFEGWNDIGARVYNTETGACHDGVHRDRLNANKGAESSLCALMAQLHIRAMRASAAPVKTPSGQSDSNRAQLARMARV